MKIVVNGKNEEVASGKKVIDVLESKNIKPEVVAVELNGEILDKPAYQTQGIKDGDQLEFVYYMGGGEFENQIQKCGGVVANNVAELIGNTPLIKLNRVVEPDMAEILAKVESANPGGSVKDRLAKAMIEAAEDSRKLKPGGTIIEPTSGNTGIGLAMIAAAKGYKCVLVMPESMSLERIYILKSYGAEVVLTPAIEAMSGAIRKAEKLLAKTPGSFMPQQFKNPANPEVHRKTTAREILVATGKSVDAFVAGVGTGGTITGVGEVLKKEIPGVKIIAVEPESSAILSGRSAGPHKIQGIGAGFVPEVLDRKVIDEVITVDDDKAFNLSKRLAKEEGLFVGISAGAAAFAALKVAKELGKGKRVVTILPDTGERYFSMEQYFIG
jgi:cysteine synthase A